VRLFVALVPPEPALEHLELFLAPRQAVGQGLRWAAPEQWHLTLAFMPEVPARCLDDLGERLTRAAARRTPFDVALRAGGAFPDAARAKVLYAGVDAGASGEELARLSAGARAAAAKAGAAPDGGRLVPHVTLARLRAPLDVTRWLRVLESYRGPAWAADTLTLVESHLGQGPRGRPRHTVVDTFRLAAAPPEA
jgi:2'-5' RNA ligase